MKYLIDNIFLRNQIKMDYDILYKILIIGESGVGKSCILLRYCDDIYDTSYISTIGVDFKIKTIRYENKIIKLQIWDTAGQERFKTITASYYRGANCIMVVYSISDKDSYLKIKDWIYDIKIHNINMDNVFIVGNKTDDNENRQIMKNEAQDYCDDNKFKYFETSAKNNIGINDLFNDIVSHLNKQPDISNTPKQLNLNNVPNNKKCCGY